MILLLFLILFPGARLNTSFYTFHKLGSYSISDLYFNYLFSRYNFSLALEKRQEESGLKGFCIGIDSVLKYYYLTIGEKQYHLNGPLNTTLPLWGAVLSGEDINLFLGKTKDQTSSLPPTFHQNNYTFGFKIIKNFTYRLPVEFYFLKKNDAYGDITDNNSLGSNTRIKIGENLRLDSRLGLNLCRIGVGGGLGLGMNYTGQRYGVNAYYRKIFNNFVTPSNLIVDEGDWFQLNSHIQPFYWFSFGQRIDYSNLYGLAFGSNWTVNKFPSPEFGYGFDFNLKNETFGQNLHSGWRYKRFSVGADFAWSSLGQSFGLKLNQDIKNLRFWYQMQVKDGRSYQWGCIFQPSSAVRTKLFFNLSFLNEWVKSLKGVELSLRLFKNFSLNTTYELISHNSANEHLISLSMSNNLFFKQTGFGFISGNVFMDLNNNGIFDKDDCAVSDAEVILDNKISTKTDRGGRYQFSFVSPGEHRIHLKLVSMPAEIGTEKMARVVNTKFLSRSRVYFPLSELGLIEGVVYYDDNKNGRMEPEERGVPNVVLSLNGYLTTTEKNGRFRFANLASGTYALEIKLLPPETFLSIPEISYIYLKPGEKFVDYQIDLIRKERPVQKKTFEEPQIVKPKLPVPSKSKPPQFTDEEIENLFKKGVAYFIANQYNEALKIFNQVLTLNPNHKRALEYKRRTLRRLEVLRK